jgi:hypothetical protein
MSGFFQLYGRIILDFYILVTVANFSIFFVEVYATSNEQYMKQLRAHTSFSYAFMLLYLAISREYQLCSLTHHCLK